MKHYIINNWLRRKNTSSIEKFDAFNDQNRLIRNLRKELLTIDKKISDTTKELISAISVGIKANLSRDKNWFDKFQRNIY